MLPTPPKLAQYPTDMVALVADAKGVGDELRHPPGCPDVAAKPVGFCSLRQVKWQLCPLLLAQSRSHPKRWPQLDPFNPAVLACPLEPLATAPVLTPSAPG